MKPYPKNLITSGKSGNTTRAGKKGNGYAYLQKTTALVLTGAAILLGMAGCGTSNPGTGARDGDISIVAREEGSGTRGAFVEIMGVVDADGVDATVQTAEVVNSTAVVTQTVVGDPAAIGYISMGSLDSTVKALAVDGVAATVEHVRDGSLCGVPSLPHLLPGRWSHGSGGETL